MKTVLLFPCLLMIGLMSLYGQSEVRQDASVEKVTNHFLLSPGLVYSSIQNNNFSRVNWFGLGGVLGLSFQKTTPSYLLNIGIDIPFTAVAARTHDKTGTIFNPSMNVTYYRSLNKKIALGTRWDIMDYYVHNQSELGNNQTYNLQSSSLFASVRYLSTRKSKKPVWAILHLGLLHFNREGFSFAFAAPQNVLEEGHFDYQDNVIDNPLGFKYYELDFLNAYLNIRTSLGIQLTERSGISYEWQMRHFSEVKGYATTTGQHLLKYNFALIHE